MFFRFSLVIISAFFVTVSAVAAPPSGAADVLDVSRAISEAREKNPAYQKAQAALGEASWRRLEALSAQLPQLSVTGLKLLSEQYPSLPFGGTVVQIPEPFATAVYYTANWMVFDGFSTPLRYAAAQLNKSAAELELERAALEIEDRVRLAFYRALAARLLAAVADQNLKTLEDHYEKAKDLLAEGQATKFDILRIKVQLNEAYPDKASAEDDVITSREALAEVMGIPTDARALGGNLPIPTKDRLPTNLKFDVGRRQDVQALEDRASSVGRSHAASYLNWFPQIGLQYQGQYYNVSDSNVNFNSAYIFGLTLTWNVFDGGATIARQQETYYQMQQAEAAASAATLAAPNQFDFWKRKYGYNVQLYEARQQAIDAAEESVRLARVGYQAGTNTSTDVLDAELDLFRARAGLVKAQIDGAEALINLELSVGRKL